MWSSSEWDRWSQTNQQPRQSLTLQICATFFFLRAICRQRHLLNWRLLCLSESPPDQRTEGLETPSSRRIAEIPQNKGVSSLTPCCSEWSANRQPGPPWSRVRGAASRPCQARKLSTICISLGKGLRPPCPRAPSPPHLPGLGAATRVSRQCVPGEASTWVPPQGRPGRGGGVGTSPEQRQPSAAGTMRTPDFDTLATVGTGTFGRVHLVKEKTAKHFFALKVMSIPDVIRLKQEQHVHNEKSVLKEVSHPFLIRLFWTWHDERFLYMLMEYVPGGELFSYLRNRGRFSSTTGLFYSAEIICAIEYLHSKEIVYRDLKPENILLDRDGHIKLTDFGFAKKLVDRTWTLCGTPEYLAPEVIQSKGHGRAVDWWALGILIFEMLSGFPPFFDDNPFGIYQKILAGKIDFPRHLDFHVKDLIKKLLVVDRTRRLGNMKNGANDVKRHRWFHSVDWEAVPQRKLKPPIVPKIAGDGDTSNFETYPENDWDTATPVPQKDLEIFKNF
ncbi:hypothetical protein H8957_002457 [Semnopithecus entellus]